MPSRHLVDSMGNSYPVAGPSNEPADLTSPNSNSSLLRVTAKGREHTYNNNMEPTKMGKFFSTDYDRSTSFPNQQPATHTTNLAPNISQSSADSTDRTRDAECSESTSLLKNPPADGSPRGKPGKPQIMQATSLASPSELSLQDSAMILPPETTPQHSSEDHHHSSHSGSESGTKSGSEEVAMAPPPRHPFVYKSELANPLLCRMHELCWQTQYTRPVRELLREVLDVRYPRSRGGGSSRVAVTAVQSEGGGAETSALLGVGRENSGRHRSTTTDQGVLGCCWWWTCLLCHRQRSREEEEG